MSDRHASVDGSASSDAACEVTVVIPTYNRGADVMRALRSLAAQEGPPLQVIVVDNSSTDNTEHLIATAQPVWGGRLHYLRKSPQGPASARNAGLALARTPWVLFHDSDIELPPHWVQHASRHLGRDPALVAVGGLILYAFDPARVNAFGGELNAFGLAWDVDEGQALALRHGAPTQGARRLWINCSVMLARREAVIAAGAFDERYFYGYEDTDLGWRLRMPGGDVQVFPDLHALHHVDAATGPAHPDIVFHACKNRLAMLLRNVQAHRLPWVLAAYAAYTAADILLHGPRAPKWRALWWNLRQWQATQALRRLTQGARQVSDAEIFRCGSGHWFPPTRLKGRRRRAVPSQADAGSMALQHKTDDRV